MTVAIPEKPSVESSVSSSEERIRRLELRPRGGIAQAVPEETTPAPEGEPDYIVQWLQRGGSNIVGSTYPLQVGSDAMFTANGPLTRYLWDQEQTLIGGSEAFYRQVRELRQRLKLLPHPRNIGTLYPDGRAARYMYSGGPNFYSTGSFSGSGWAFWQTTTGKVTTLACSAEPGDVWTYAETMATPTCDSCFGLPCAVGFTACTQHEIDFNFASMFAPYADGVWIWGTQAGGNFWVDAEEGRGNHGVHDPGGNPVYGEVQYYGCVASEVNPWYLTHTCDQAACQFGSIYGFFADTHPDCPPCLVTGGRTYFNGGEQVRWLSKYTGFVFHTMAQQIGASFCGGVVSNQIGSPTTSLFVVPESVLAGAPIVDATPVDRSLVGTWNYRYSGGGPNYDAWHFNEWQYEGERGPSEGAVVGNIWRGEGAWDPGSVSTTGAQDWNDLRARVYAELATGRYRAVCSWLTARVSVFTHTPEPGWTEVPLCANWYGSLKYRRIGGVVEWKGTIRNLQPIVAQQVALASFVPQEALPATTRGGNYGYMVVTTPTGPLLLTVTVENFYDLGVTASIYVTKAHQGALYASGPIDFDGTHSYAPVTVRPVVQTNPSGPYEEITFDGASYHGCDLPLVVYEGSSGPIPWLTTTPPGPALDCGSVAYDLP